MSVNINFRAAPESNKWDAIKNGDYAIIEGNDQTHIPNGLYRVFLIPQQETGTRVVCLFPLFEGPFADGLFPFFIDPAIGYPKLKHRISKVNIDVEVVE